MKEIWANVKENIKNEMSGPSFNTWFTNTELVHLSNSEATIMAENEFNQDWLESHYIELITKMFYETIGENVKVTIISAEDQHAKDIAEKHDEVVDNFITHNPLNRSNTFETFVIGSGNRFSHAASLAVAEEPGKAYNPLFIYGGVGLGKTHLMHSIGNYVLENQPDAKVVYITSERFTNEFISSIRENKPEAFRDKYRNVDVLLIDDIQFLAKKEQTQEEFFNTFNELHQNNKQIVISSDRTPAEIPTLEDRLTSRFAMGLITDITPPDLETRLAILRQKCEEENVSIPNDAMMYIANHIQTNIRELEGALTRVAAYAKLNNQTLTPEMVSDVLKDLIKIQKEKKLTIDDIKEVVGEYYSISIEDFASKKRTKSITFPRQVAMYLARELTDFSLPKIGEMFGGRDHSTVIHAHEKISKALNDDPMFKDEMKDIENRLNP